MSQKKKDIPIKGLCYFYSETGTEGGFWAFQDSAYIQHNVGYGYCKKCGKWLCKQEGPIHIERVELIDAAYIEELRRTGKVPKRPECPDGIHEEEVGDSFSYEGLHVLENGDELAIFDKNKPMCVVWHGIIDQVLLPLFTQTTSDGLWIHYDQRNVARRQWEIWFLDQYPAELVKAPPKQKRKRPRRKS